MKRLVTLSFLMVMLASGAAMAQNTQTTTATVNVQGVLELDAITGTVDFGTNAPGDVANPASGTLVAVFRDSTTGTTGYHLTLQSGDFSDGGSNTITADNFEVEDLGGTFTLSPAAGNTNTAPTIDPSLNVPAALDTAVRLLEADQSVDGTTGKGEWTLTITNADAFTLNIPGTTVPTSYTATMTFSLNSGI